MGPKANKKNKKKNSMPSTPKENGDSNTLDQPQTPAEDPNPDFSTPFEQPQTPSGALDSDKGAAGYFKNVFRKNLVADPETIDENEPSTHTSDAPRREKEEELSKADDALQAWGMDAPEREAADQEAIEREANNTTSNGDLPDVEPATTPKENEPAAEPSNERFIHEDDAANIPREDALNVASEHVPELVPDTLNHELVTSGGPVPLVMPESTIGHSIHDTIAPATLDHLREDRGDIVPPVVTEEERSMGAASHEQEVQSVVSKPSEVLTTDPEQRLEALQRETEPPIHAPILESEAISHVVEPIVHADPLEPEVEPVAEHTIEPTTRHTVEQTIESEPILGPEQPEVLAEEPVQQEQTLTTIDPVVESDTVVHEFHPTNVLEPIQVPDHIGEIIEDPVVPSTIIEAEPELVKDLNPTAEIVNDIAPIEHESREVAHDHHAVVTDPVNVEEPSTRDVETIQPADVHTVEEPLVVESSTIEEPHAPEPATVEPETDVIDQSTQPVTEQADGSREVTGEVEPSHEAAVAQEQPQDTYQHTPIDPPKPPTLKSLTSKDPNFTATRYLSMHSNTFTSRPHYGANVSLDLDARNMGSSLTNWYNKIYVFTERFEWPSGWHVPEELDYLINAMDESFPQICCNMWSAKEFFNRKQRQTGTADIDEKHEKFCEWKSRLAVAAFCANFACREVFGKSIFGLENPMIKALGSAMSVFAKELEDEITATRFRHMTTKLLFESPAFKKSTQKQISQLSSELSNVLSPLSSLLPRPVQQPIPVPSDEAPTTQAIGSSIPATPTLTELVETSVLKPTVILHNTVQKDQIYFALFHPLPLQEFDPETMEELTFNGMGAGKGNVGLVCCPGLVKLGFPKYGEKHDIEIVSKAKVIREGGVEWESESEPVGEGVL